MILFPEYVKRVASKPQLIYYIGDEVCYAHCPMSNLNSPKIKEKYYK